MKKYLALLIVLTLLLSCLPGTAMAENYQSKLLKKTISLPSKMKVVDEQKLEDGSGVEFTISVEGRPDEVIYTDVQKIAEYKGYSMKTLPDTVLDSWTEYYYQYYPENASAGRLESNSGKGDALYCYCGQTKDGESLLVYESLNNQLCVSSICMSQKGGFSKVTMQAALEALNAVNAAFEKAASVTAAGNTAPGGSKRAAPSIYSHLDYDTLIVYLLLEDDDDFDLYDDVDFDWDYDDWDDDLYWDETELLDDGLGLYLDDGDWLDDGWDAGDWSGDDWSDGYDDYDYGGYDDYDYGDFDY